MEFLKQSYWNPYYINVNNKAHEIERIILHDGEKIIATTRWFGDFIMDSNSSNKKIIINEIECKIKKVVDLKENCFIIPTTYEYTLLNEKRKDLYINVKYFDFEMKYSISSLTLEKHYHSKRFDIYFSQVIEFLDKESRNFQFNTIDKTIKEMENSSYDMKKLELLNKDLTKQINKYNKIVVKEKEKVINLKEIVYKNLLTYQSI